jgi:glycerol-3-phosphate acyltransferase PlsY
MGKGLAAAEIIVGIILLLTVMALAIGMVATNTPIIIAAIVAIFGLILFVLAIVLFWRASLNIKRANTNTNTNTITK